MKPIIRFILAVVAIVAICIPAKAQISGPTTINAIATGYARNGNTNFVTPILIDCTQFRNLNIQLKGQAVNSNSTFTVFGCKSPTPLTNDMESTPSLTFTLSCTNTVPCRTNINIDIGGTGYVFLTQATNALDVTTNPAVILFQKVGQ